MKEVKNEKLKEKNRNYIQKYSCYVIIYHRLHIMIRIMVINLVTICNLKNLDNIKASC